MARFMNQVITYDEACLVSWQGGNMRNAIPRECEVVITVPAEEEADVLEFVQECEACGMKNIMYTKHRSASRQNGWNCLR